MGYDFMSSRTTCSTYNLMTCCDSARSKVLKYICDLYRLKYDEQFHRNSPAHELRDNWTPALFFQRSANRPKFKYQFSSLVIRIGTRVFYGSPPLAQEQQTSVYGVTVKY